MSFFFIQGRLLTGCTAIIFAAFWMLIPASAVLKGMSMRNRRLYKGFGRNKEC
jgi:membrane protease YdiL (CAAX protease family)